MQNYKNGMYVSFKDDCVPENKFITHVSKWQSSESTFEENLTLEKSGTWSFLFVNKP